MAPGLSPLILTAVLALAGAPPVLDGRAAFRRAFSECVGETSRPFSAGAARLRAAGANVRTIVISGRSGTGHNARQIADTLAASPMVEDRRVILIGYSKGGLDILRFLVDFPELAAPACAALVARPDPSLFPLEQLFVTMVAFAADDLKRNAGGMQDISVAGPEEKGQ